MKPLVSILLGSLVVIATAVAFLVPDAKGFQSPELARILFFHLPCALLSAWFFVLAAGWGGALLARRRPEWAAKMDASIELGTLFAFLTLVTGVIFSRVQWGAWWQNDPRQTSFLFVFLGYAALLAVKSAYRDPEKRTTVTAAYAVALILPALFLTFVFPRLPEVVRWSAHPSQTIQQGQLDIFYRTALYLNFAAFAATTWAIFRLRIRVDALETLIHDEPDSSRRGHSGHSGVVRPVAVSRPD